jgi:hypothetical protein
LKECNVGNAHVVKVDDRVDPLVTAGSALGDVVHDGGVKHFAFGINALGE